MKKLNVLSTILILFSMIITSCDLIDNMNEEPVNKGLLTEAITNAETLKAETVVGEAIGNVPQSAADNLQIAIDAAKAVDNNQEATQEDVDAAVVSLGNAVTLFSESIILSVDDSTDYSILNDTIETAQELLTGTGVGEDVGMVSQDASNTLSDAIGIATGVADDTEATQSNVNAAAITLADAVTVFIDAIITGGDVDFSILNERITVAQGLLTGTGVGDSVGMVSQDASTALSDAIGLALAVANDELATQSEVDLAVEALNTAIETFEAAIIQPPTSGELVTNGDFTGVTISDNDQTALQWSFYSGNGNTASVVNDAAVVSISALAGEWDNQLWYKDMAISEFGDSNYVLTFTASAETTTDIKVKMDLTAAAAVATDYYFRVGTTPTTYSVNVDVFGVNPVGALIDIIFVFNNLTGASTATNITIDDVSFGNADALTGTETTINITDGTDAVEGAEVTINSYTATTDSNGDAIITLQQGLYQASISATGYEVLTTFISAGAGVQDVVLTELASSHTMPYGIYSETTAGIVLESDGANGIWTNDQFVMNVNDTTDVLEGTEAISFTYDADSIGGGFICFSDTGVEENKTPTNMSDATELVFSIKPSVTLTYAEIKLEWTGGNAFVDLATYTPVSSDGWDTYTIPLSDFAGLNKEAITVAWSLWHPNNGYTGTIYIDNIIYQ